MAKNKNTAEADEEQENKGSPSAEEAKKDGTDSSSKTEEVDWEAVAKAEEARANALEGKVPDLAYKNRKAKREELEEEEDVSDDDKPLTQKDLKKVQDQIFKDTQRVSALAIARANTSSEAEAQAALAFWANRVTPSGNLEEDILFAIGGMTRSRAPAIQREIKRAEDGKSITRSDGASAVRDGEPGTEPKLNADSPLKSYKYLGNGIYAKKLASGKTLYKRPNAKQGQAKTWTD